MDAFIKQYGEKLLEFKKSIFKPSHANEFIKKLCLRGDIKTMESELTKCLINSSVTSDKALLDRKSYINEFLSEYQKIQSEIEIANEMEKSKEAKSEALAQISKDTQKKIDKPDKPEKEFLWGGFKIKNYDEEFPSFENNELVKRKKKFVVLDRHYTNKLEQGNKDCYCMSLRHPLVSNCLQCGRVHCLQEGDKVCISCGAKLVDKDDYIKSILEDSESRKAYGHKEKLLKFQSEFYSKLQIIDDFNDWYEISNNTWISQESRAYAKKKDEENVWDEEKK